MHTRRRPISFRGLLILGTVAAAACNDNAGTTTLDDAALRGATVGEVETLVADNPDGTSEEVRTCITGAHYFEGKKVRTIEGHAKRDEQGQVTELNPIQQRFVDEFAFQCSYCAPGFVNAATVLVEKLQRQPIVESKLEQVIEDSLGHHVCRCTGYVRYYNATRNVLTDLGLVKEG